MTSTRRQMVLSGLALAAGGGVPHAPEATAATPAFRVIVNETNPITSVDRKTLADVFLKKVTRWAGGEVIRPVDLRSEAAASAASTEEILRPAVSAVKSCWQL